MLRLEKPTGNEAENEPETAGWRRAQLCELVSELVARTSVLEVRGLFLRGTERPTLVIFAFSGPKAGAPVNGQTTASLLLCRTYAGIFAQARPSPTLWTALPRHSNRKRHRIRDRQIRAADHKNGGPRYGLSLVSTCGFVIHAKAHGQEGAVGGYLLTAFSRPR